MGTVHGFYLNSNNYFFPGKDTPWALSRTPGLLHGLAAFQTAGLITLFVVYRATWVYTIRGQQYLQIK